MPDEIEDDLVVVVPDQDDQDGTPQPTSRRHFWSEERIQHSPTRAERKAFKKLLVVEDSK